LRALELCQTLGSRAAAHQHVLCGVVAGSKKNLRIRQASVCPTQRAVCTNSAYRLDVEQRTFTRKGQTVSLAPKTFELLLLLIRGPHRAFSKPEIMTALWPDVFVEEANLSFQISALRKALGDDAQLIETVPKHG
jgi:DNA-binding winged helix-turn-helix (wHTH) protein